MKKPLVSVIILNWNRKKDTVELIRRLKKQTYKNFEVIVVDNASGDGSASHVKKHYPWVKVVEADKNYALWSFSLGMDKAKGKYFLHLASDTIPTNNLIAKHIEKHEKNLKLGVSCASTYEWGTKKYLGPNRAKKGDDMLGYRVTYFDGNGICLKRQIFEELGGFSKEYFICLEELEWAVRILSAGYDIAAFTDIAVYHKKSKRAGEYRSKLGYYYSRNWVWFYLKYLPFREIPRFLRLHSKSLFIKTGKGGSFRISDCVWGVVASLRLVPKFLLQRRVLAPEVVDRVKLDLFPNPYHLYVK